MRIATKDIQSIGFILKSQRSRRYPALIITDADFADDLALTSEMIKQAQLFLLKVELATAQLGLYTKKDNIKYMSFNQPLYFRNCLSFFLSFQSPLDFFCIVYF